MNKSWFIFINLHTCFQKLIIVCFCYSKRIFLIWNMGHDNRNIDSSFCSIGKCHNHFIIQNQIRCHDMYIFPGCVEDIQIYLLSHPLFSVWTDLIWHDKSIIVYRKIFRRFIVFVVFLFCFCDIPHFQEHISEPFHSFTGQSHCRILPMPETYLLVNIFVCQVCTSGERHFSVNHHDFSVVSVVIISGKNRTDRCKHLTLNSLCFQHLRIEIRQQCKNTHSIIHHTDFHAIFCLFLQNIKNAVPHNTFFYNKEFQKNEFFCFSQFFQHIFKLIISQGIILHLGMVIYRCIPVFFHIICKMSNLRIYGL